MLKLKKVEVQGFKSFCDRTELRFNGGGIAAIVGPNGCGKSNLSDAISWVLGEQSAKSLRGTRMEDVIFAGTKSRKPVGMAAVTMVLIDPEHGKAPAPPEAQDGAEAQEKVQEIAAAPTGKAGEVTITRRLFRSGESEYLIDGRQARLRDIQDIFMGSGLGPESYAIIEQGRIGQILSSKPQDRRAVIEEAAGITKYKGRRRLAEARLEGAKQNLARVFDILEEVTRQVNSLKRQAGKAKRYQELKSELEGQLRTVLAGRFMTLRTEADRAAKTLEEATAALKTAMADAAQRDGERKAAQEVFYALEVDLTSKRKHLSELKVEAERTKGKLEAHVREAASIEQRMNRAEQETGDLGSRLEANEGERRTLGESVAQLEAETQGLRTAVAEKNRLRDSIQTRVREGERTIENSRSVILRLLGEASTIRNQLAQADAYLASIERERTRISKEEEGMAAEIARLSTRKQELSEAMRQRQLEIQTVTQDRRQVEQSLLEKRRSGSELRGQIDTLRGECSRLRAKRESLENTLSHHTYTTESTKKLLLALENGKAGSFKPEGVLADFIEVDPTWERATEEFLHEELEYIVVKDWDQAERGMNLLRAEMEGRATFLVETQTAEQQDAAPHGPDLPRLADLVNFSNGLAGQARTMLPKLSGCYLAPDREQARTLAEQHPRNYFLLSDGQCYHSRMLTGGRKKSSGPLVLKREMREFATQLKANEAALQSKVQEQEKIQSEGLQLEQDLDRLRVLQQTREKDAVSLDGDLRRTSEELHRANSRVSVARLELERLKREEERTRDKQTQNSGIVEQKDGERTERESALETLREQLESAQTEAHRMGEEHAVLRAKLAGLEERNRGERATLARLESQFREMSNRRAQISSEVQRWGEHRSRILAENIELDQKLTLVTEQGSTLDAEVIALAQNEFVQRAALAQMEEVLRVLRQSIETGHARRSEVEVELTRRQSELQFLDETSRKELQVPVAELAAPEDASPEVLQAAEKAYHDTRSKIENLGAVNPTAYEEFQEAQQRQDFLTAQRQDLIDSIRDTEKAIREIDEISKAKFTDAFHAINENFKLAFQTLFGGGHGEMRLTDEGNMNESGIDIIASPPGKRLQNVLLLSGGEKAMAALALLMAVFKYQPSPFCVLDEVDAPLDEANIGRLTKLLREMAVDTQFIVITHSKKTMEAAQAMYGVTMQEQGVSKLVSVRFQHAEETAGAAA